MAIRSKPSWDMDIREINTRAEQLKRVDAYFQRERQQARADAAQADAVRADTSRAIEREIDMKLGRYWDGEKLTGVGMEYVLKHQTMPPENARADAESSDGLRMTVQHDNTGREIRTFTNTGQHKKWMDTFKAVPEEMVMLNEDNIPFDQFGAVEAKWRATRALKEQAARKIAAGEPVYCDLTYTCYDLQG